VVGEHGAFCGDGVAARFLERMVAPVPVNRFAKFAVERTLPGRILGYGAVEIDAAGTAGAEVLDHLPTPNRIRDEVFVQSERLRHGSGQGQPAPSPAV